MNKIFKFLKDNWFFIINDIYSYLISTVLYLGLCLIKYCSIQSIIYGLFDCLVFYIPFWIIRISFSDTYHSGNFKHCMKWTRIMLCVGVFVLWILPIPYTLFNGLFVAFVCCLILYLVAIETNEKKEIRKQLKKFTDKTIWNMTEEELRTYLYCKYIRQEKLEFVVMIIIHQMTYAEISNKLGFSVDTLKDWSPILKKKLNIKSWDKDKN